MSGLGGKLAALRRQSGAQPDAPVGAGAARESADTAATTPTSPDTSRDTPSLRERIQRAGTARRDAARAAPSRLDDADLAALLQGEASAPGLITVDRTIAFGQHHGEHRLDPSAIHALTYFGHDTEAVFMDTETTGLAGGTGTAVFLIGLGRFTAQGLLVRQYFLTGFAGEPALLESAAGFVAGAKSLVTFNGKSFDSPLLATRYRLAGMPDPFADLPHLDLLHATRRAYAGRWENCRLQTAERELLRFARSDDLPGAEAPMAWFEWVRFGIHARLPALLRHNHWDVLTLAALLQRLEAAHRAPAPNHANVLAVARHTAGAEGENAAYAHLLEHRHVLDRPGLLALARLARRRGDWAVATSIWAPLAEQGCVESLERLAKYHEHQAANPHAALALTKRLLSAQPDNPRHRHRSQRLAARIRADAAPFM